MPLPTRMKAAVVHAFGEPLHLEDVAVPRPGPGEVLMKTITSGVCHTDLHAAEGDWPVKPALPLIPGHEGMGYVAAVGAGVRNVKEGDIIGVPWLYSACGHCEHCVGGWETLCESQRNTGYGVNGGYAEYVLADANYVGRFPSGINFLEMAPVLCAGVTVYKGLKDTEARPGEWVGISGVGGLGHMAVQYAKAMGYKVAAIDIGADKLALAKQLGADLAYDALDPRLPQELKADTGGGLHAMLVTAAANSAFRQAMQVLRRKGFLVMVGLPPGGFELPIFETVLNRYTVRGSIVGTRNDLQEAIQFAIDGKVRATVTAARLDDINTIFQQMKAGTIEGRIVMDVAGALGETTRADARLDLVPA